jgi:lipopolysaccharide transport system permease protein
MSVAAAVSGQPPGHIVEIEPSTGLRPVHIGELWAYRELLYFLAWRDVKVRYKQTLLGASWAILQPLLATVVFTVFFGHVAHLQSEGVPYMLFSFVALLAWTYVSSGFTNAAASLVSGASMVTKVYFPRLALPISAVLGGAVDFACASVLLVPLMAAYGVAPTWRLVALPAFVLLATFTALGVGFAFAALNVRFRDVRYIVPFLTQLWLFATPVVYSAASLDEPWKTLYGLNPMVGVVEGFRWSILSTGRSPDWSTTLSAASALVLLAVGLLYFRKTEDSFADVI